MKILFLFGLVISASSFAKTNHFCLGQINGASGYGSIMGYFSYEFWCSNGLVRKFQGSGCYTDSCENSFRQKIQKIQIAQLGFKLVKQLGLRQNNETIFLYSSVMNSDIDFSQCDFAHKVTSHTGFATNRERATLHLSKNEVLSVIDFGATDSSEYMNYEFRDHTLIQKISRDTPRMQLSEFSIYLRNQ